MAMSLKKIGAIVAGGAMVASALAGGVMAATTSGDVSGFMENAVKDGQPNVCIVVGSGAAAADVVSASDIAAKIGSMCYKEGSVTDGSANINLFVEADSDLTNDLDATYAAGSQFLIFTTSKRSYTTGLGTTAIVGNANVVDDVPGVGLIENLPRLSTLIESKDIDPADVSDDTKADATEFLLASVLKNGNDDYDIDKGDLVYGSIAFTDGNSGMANTQELYLGTEIPMLGEMKTIVDTDDDNIYLGTKAYKGNIKEGTEYDLGNGYSVKVNSVLIPITGGAANVDISILKDGNVIETKDDQAPFELVADGIGVNVYDAYQDVSGNYGYASLIISKDVKEYKLGEEYTKDWKLYAITNNAGNLALSDNDFSEDSSNVGAGAKEKFLKDSTTNNNVIGLALKYDGDKIEGLKDGKSADFLDYAKLEFTDDDSAPALYAKYTMSVSKDITATLGDKVTALNTEIKLKSLNANAQQVVPVKAPIAKLDTEASLDDATKNLILVGGPVVNKLTKELADAGKVTIDNDSPATLQVLEGAANGNDVLVVAGGDREKTREAALDLIENY